MKNTLLTASEVVPFIKTGGLADVAGSLPACFDRRYYDVRVVLPKYLCIPEKYRNQMEYATYFYMNSNSMDRYVGVLGLIEDGIASYLIDNESYLGGSRPYGDWLYGLEKFVFFSRAALSALPLLNFRPDLIHYHNRQTGLILVYLKERFAGGEFFRGIKSVMIVHNLKLQGIWDVRTIEYTTGLSEYFFTPDKLESYKNGNSLKGGIVYADAVTTMSPTYAEEIQMPFYGEDLDGLTRVRRSSFRGTVNGIDYREFDPVTDPEIAECHDVKNFRHEKKRNKAALQECLGLLVDDKKFVLGVVSRLTDQKGFDLIQGAIGELCQEDLQFVILGTGGERYENLFRHYDWKYHDKLSTQIYYSDDMAHAIYAGADAYLIPSPFEFCGLSQMIVLHYGTLPIVREIGGLKDAVEPYNEFANTGTGFCFANYNAREMLDCIRYVKRIYSERRRDWNHTVDRAMQADYSWQQSALKYQELYDWLTGY